MPTGIYNRKFNDLTGERFGKLIVIEFKGRTKGFVMWLCKCDCGNEKVIRGVNLTSPNKPTRSCGCNHVMCTNAKHNSAKTRLYRIWANMKTRCYNTKNYKYKRYGARGITICEEWKEDFEIFKKWALENGYDDNLTIDRKNNNGNYEPSNCRWVNDFKQANNKSNNIHYEIKGENHTLAEWCRIYNSFYYSVWNAIKIKNENLEESLIRYKRT
jgi:hypothetical protein